MKLIQPPTRVSESLIWNLSDKFYCEAGPDAWGDNLVPQGITSNCAIADVYASIAAAFLRDLARQGCTETALIIEAGGGSGLFAWQFLRRLRHHHLTAAAPAAPFQYLLTDGAPRNIAHWKTRDRFAPLREQGVLDFGLMLVGESFEIQTENSGTMTVSSLGNRPVLLIGNYLHCSIRSDLFRVRGQKLYQELLSLEEREPKPGTSIGALGRIRPIYSQVEQPESTHTGHPIIDRVLESYRSLPGDHCIPVPETSIRFLEHFLRRDAPFVHLSSDLGYSEPVTISHKDPFIFDHYLAMRTNFHMMAEVFRAYGGQAQLPAFDTPHFMTAALIRPGKGGDLEGTALTARQLLWEYTPLDSHNLQSHFRNLEGPMSWRHTSAWLCLSKFDATIARKTIPRLMAGLPKERKLNANHLRGMYLEAFETYFPDGVDEPDLDICIARLFLRVGLNQDAYDLLERGFAEFGRTTARLYEAALACIRLGWTEKAGTLAEESLRADPDFEPAQKLVEAFRAAEEADAVAAA